MGVHGCIKGEREVDMGDRIDSFIGVYPVPCETTYIVSKGNLLRHWRCYRKYHSDGGWTETLVKDADWWRWVKIRTRRLVRKIFR